MSDQEDKKSPDQLYTEWQRVLGNPDNLIVSDSLRAALPDEFTENENVSSALEISIGIGEIDIVAPMTRLDMTSSMWLCQVSVDSNDASVLLSYTMDEIMTSIVELKDKGNTIKALEVGDNDRLALSVDTDGQAYFITLSCEKNQETTDET